MDAGKLPVQNFFIFVYRCLHIYMQISVIKQPNDGINKGKKSVLS